MYTSENVPPQANEKVEMSEIVEMMKNPDFLKFVKTFKKSGKEEEEVKNENKIEKKTERVLTLEDHKRLYSHFLKIKLRNRKNMMIRKMKNLKIAKSCRQFDSTYYRETMKQSLEKHNQVAKDTKKDYSPNIDSNKERLKYIEQEKLEKILQKKEVQELWEKIEIQKRDMNQYHNIHINKNEKKGMEIQDFFKFFFLHKKSNVVFEKGNEILPRNYYDSIYYVSYFVAFMKDESVKLLPFIVKLNKHKNNYNDFEYFQYFQKMISKYDLKDLFNYNYCSIEKFMEYSTFSNLDKKTINTKILPKINDFFKNQIGMYKENDINMCYHETMNNFKEVKNNYLHHLKNEDKKELNIIEKKIEYKDFYVLDNDFTLEFYKLYLKMYGDENIENIDFIWNCKDNELKEDEEQFMSISPHIFKYDFLRKNDFNIIEEEYVEKYNIHNYCFQVSELYDFKDAYPYLLENCFQYSFEKGVEIDEILGFFDDFKKYNESKKKFKNTLKQNKKIVEPNNNYFTQNDNLGSQGEWFDLETGQPVEKKGGHSVLKKMVESLEKKKNETQYIKSQEPSPWDPYSNSHLGSELNPKSCGSFTHLEEFNPSTSLYSHYEQLNPATSYEKRILKECNLNEYFEPLNVHVSPNVVGVDTQSTSIHDLQNNTPKTYIQLYQKSTKESLLFDMDLSQPLKLIIENNFDVWFGNDFEYIKIFTSDSIQCDIEVLMKSFHKTLFEKKQMIHDEWKYLERKVFKLKNEVKNASPLSVEDCALIIKKHFYINDNPNNRIRSTELNTMFIEIINEELMTQNKCIDDEYIISIFVDIVKELGLKKKRYSAGNFYYGIEKKN